MLTLDKENCLSFHAKNKILSAATGHRLQTWSLTHAKSVYNKCMLCQSLQVSCPQQSLGWFAVPPPPPPQLALSSYLLAKTLFWQFLFINIWFQSDQVIYFCLVFQWSTNKVIFHNITAKTCPVSGGLPVNSVKCSISLNQLISLMDVILSVNLSVLSILIHC